MQINQLKLHHFRNHFETEVQWASHLNLITGPNGAGKTSLIDAIHYLCMSRSFVSSSDQYTVQFGEKEFSLDASFSGKIRSSFNLKCQYERGKGKSFEINGSKLDRLTDLIGMVPVVTLSPEDRSLTKEGPIFRRSFLDSFISQLSRDYLSALVAYKTILRQRNKLLEFAHLDKYILQSQLEPWNMQMAEKGAFIVHERLRVVEKFRCHLKDQYEKISGIPLVPDLSYKNFLKATIDDDIKDLKAAFLDLIQLNFEKELERKKTSVGPQRDDLQFTLNGQELRYFGSQGQHRLFGLALKMAQLFYYEHELEDLPIFIMDDVFGDIDPTKIELILQMLAKHEGQIFITAANPVLFDSLNQHLDAQKDQHFSVQLDGDVSQY